MGRGFPKGQLGSGFQAGARAGGALRQFRGMPSRSAPRRLYRLHAQVSGVLLMARQRRSNDWGFPRWRGYGAGREAIEVRLCDRHGCSDPGTCPAPKSPSSAERWHFCETHAAEYNRGWNYFEGLDKEETARRARAENAGSRGYAQSAHYGWGGAGDGSRSADEMRALEVFGLEADSDFEAVKKAWRAKAKLVHPDVRPGDAAAAEAFQTLQLAYEVLRQAEERRSWRG